MSTFLDSLKYDKDGLVAVVAQHVDTGEVLMQAFADRAALNETLQTGLGTFYSRSRRQRWCKGESSGHFLRVQRVFLDCDRDALVYLSDPLGPACHTGASEPGVQEAGSSGSSQHMPASTLWALERIIEDRRQALAAQQPGDKPSWTAKLLSDPQLLCRKVREEAGELCQSLEQQEGRERSASEMADLLYHAMVLLNVQGVSLEEVMRVLRQRFATSGLEEKASRKPK
ncbi:hypothetical protein V8C86DRAFT_1790739 [Haematococcus lacustris]